MPFHPEGSSAVAWTRWWEIVPSHSTSAKMTTTRLRGASRLLTRCQREYGWKEDLAKRVLLAYKDFIYAGSFLPSDKKDWLLPSPYVHKVWQQHIFDTKHYANDCQQLLGHFLQYNLYRQDDDLVTKYQKTIEFIKEKTGQDQLDDLVWKFQYPISFSNSNLKSSKNASETLHQAKPTPLKRSLSYVENDGNDDDDQEEKSKNDEVPQERPQKRTRRSERKHPWDKKSADAPTQIQIHFQLAKSCLESKQNENSLMKDFALAKHVPLNRIFLEFAKSQEIERKCLTFRCNGTVLEGTETLHVLRKQHSTSDNENGAITIACESALVEC